MVGRGYCGSAHLRRSAFGGTGDGAKSVHDHRALSPRAGSRTSCRPDVSIWRQHLRAPPLSIAATAPAIGKTLFDVLLPVAAPRLHN